MGKVETGEGEKGARTRFQRFETAEISRAEVRGAPYNPRRISRGARARLKGKIESVGLVNALVWNRRTGNLVSGHQRLGILDELEGGTNYRLTVAVVDVDERGERELNVFLNNASSMGVFDDVALARVLREFAGKLEELGFADGELDYLLEAPPLDVGERPDTSVDAGGHPDTSVDAGGRGRTTQERTQVVAVFRDAGETVAFLRLLGVPLGTKYVDGARRFGRWILEGGRGVEKNEHEKQDTGDEKKIGEAGEGGAGEAGAAGGGGDAAPAV